MNLLIILQVLHQVEQLRAHERWDRPQLATYQAEALRQVRADAYAHSPFYQHFHQGLTDRPLPELPVLTKALLMEHFDDLVTDRAIQRTAVEAYRAHPPGAGRFLGRYWVNATSGSTGQPGLFLFNRAEWVMVLASFARAREWAGVRTDLRHRTKMASVASTTPWHMSALVAATLDSWWLPALRLAASTPVDALVRQLNDWQPEMLIAYASMARLLADEQRQGRLAIHPQLIFTSSEVLTDESRRRIEAVWGQRVFNEYAATETGGLAAECTHHQGLHLLEDLAIVEVVDQDNQPVPPGVYGTKILLTGLFNRTQPLIRYELTDSLRLAATPCSCGRIFTLVDGVQGRTEDVLRFPALTGGEVAVQPLVFHQLLDAVPARGWQIVQEADGLGVLLSGVASDWSDDLLIGALRQALAAQGAQAPAITVQRVPAIPQTASGKAPLIQALPRRSAGPPAGPARC